MYNSRTGKWGSVDALAGDYPGISSYAFALNTPIQAYDPDGNLVLFVNGLRLTTAAGDQRMPRGGYTGDPEPGIYKYGEYNGPLRTYWNNDGQPNSFGRNVDLVKQFTKAIGDNNAYFASGSSTWSSQASDRAAEGAEKGETFHRMVQSGEIELKAGETIKIVAHSQGGAHAAGLANKLLEYKDADGNQIYKIEVIYCITCHQPGDIELPEGVRGVP
jgi:hypothetical protein